MKRHFQNILYALPVFLSFAGLLKLFTVRSEEKNVFILGFSKFRLLLITVSLAFTLFSLLIFLFRKKKLTFLYYFSGFIGLLSAGILLFSRFPSDDTRNLIPLTAERCSPLLWVMLANALIWILALSLSSPDAGFPRYYSLFLLITAVGIYWGISSHIDRFAWQIDLQGNTGLCMAVVITAVLWTAALHAEIPRGWKTAAGCLFFCVLGYSVTRSTGMWMGRGNTPPKAYWNELSEAFLQGRLYLEHPSGTHDLTLYDGKWYVPNPPLPGILLMPFVLIGGSAQSVNMCVYSALIAGIDAALFFLLLILAFVRKGSPLFQQSVNGNLYPGKSLQMAGWVAVMFVFGTDHLWLGTTGQMWFISQLLVVSFTLLACIFVICEFSPIFAGAALGLGMLCRPNIFPVWLCLLGLWLHQKQAFPRIKWKETFNWCLKSAVPVIISVGLLLFYNKIRFDDWMDFGYVTINGADWILDAVQKYGIFHPHFFRINADVMFFGRPALDFSGERFFFQPHTAGYSIFLMTPPLIYVFRSFWKNWFAAGAWASVLLSVGLLLLYHNTGAEQIGYRYLLDIAAPLSLLTADGMRRKVSIFFKVLTVFAILMSFLGIYWWYLGRV